jgi:methionyl-tRNA formyltransferase
MQSLRIIYMGTPEFAVPALQQLVADGQQVVGVITAPDKPKGRGQKLEPSPVKVAALEHHIPVLQPTNLKDPAFLEELKSYQADLQVVVAFRMLPEAVWAMPRLGTFNLHASLLPKYRGAAPINWAIINGETETGVTTFFLQQAIDTGNILFQETEPIHPTDTVGSLYERLMQKGAQLVVKTVRAIATGNYSPIPQPQETADLPSAPKIFKDTCAINWSLPAEQVYNFVRGLAPYPSAWTVWNGKTYKIHEVEVMDHSTEGTPGTWQTDEKTYLHVHTGKGKVAVKSLQQEGKKRMQIDEFFRGNKL